MLKKLSAKLKYFPLAKKLTILLILIFVGGIILSGIALANILNYKAQAQINSKALLLSETIKYVRHYTNIEVAPQLNDRIETDDFLPQTIPSYSAWKVFEQLQKDNNSYKEFYYKDAMLNTSNIGEKSEGFGDRYLYSQPVAEAIYRSTEQENRPSSRSRKYGRYEC